MRRHSVQATDRAIDRSSDRPIERSSGDRATERQNERATERPRDRATERPSDRNTERPSDRATERPSDRATELSRDRNFKDNYLRKVHFASSRASSDTMPEPSDVESCWVTLFTRIGASNGPNIVQNVSLNKQNRSFNFCCRPQGPTTTGNRVFQKYK